MSNNNQLSYRTIEIGGQQFLSNGNVSVNIKNIQYISIKHYHSQVLDRYTKCIQLYTKGGGDIVEECIKDGEDETPNYKFLKKFLNLNEK